MADDEKSLKFRQSKGFICSIADNYLMKLNMYDQNMFIYIQYKFQEILSLGYLVMAEDTKKSLKFRQSKGNSCS